MNFTISIFSNYLAIMQLVQCRMLVRLSRSGMNKWAAYTVNC